MKSFDCILVVRSTKRDVTFFSTPYVQDCSYIYSKLDEIRKRISSGSNKLNPFICGFGKH